MAPRVPRLPAAKTSEVICMGAAGVGVLAPFWFLLPGTEDRVAKQTNKWAPRWERNVSYLTPPMERGVQRIEPPIARAVQRIPERLPLERMAKSVDRSIRKNIDRFSGGPSSS